MTSKCYCIHQHRTSKYLANHHFELKLKSWLWIRTSSMCQNIELKQTRNSTIFFRVRVYAKIRDTISASKKSVNFLSTSLLKKKKRIPEESWRSHNHDVGDMRGMYDSDWFLGLCQPSGWKRLADIYQILLTYNEWVVCWSWTTWPPFSNCNELINILLTTTQVFYQNDKGSKFQSRSCYGFSKSYNELKERMTLNSGRFIKEL